MASSGVCHDVVSRPSVLALLSLMYIILAMVQIIVLVMCMVI